MDFESDNNQLDVTVQVIGSFEVNAPLRITLNDVDEAPTAVTLGNEVTTLDENTSIRTPATSTVTALPTSSSEHTGATMVAPMPARPMSCSAARPG